MDLLHGGTYKPSAVIGLSDGDAVLASLGEDGRAIPPVTGAEGEDLVVDCSHGLYVP
ncbi:MAG: hypothetical protein WBL39_09065 [Terrimicrobiaceae bacterium]